MKPTRSTAALLTAVCLSFSGCSGPPSLGGDVSPEVMLDREARFAAREQAVEEVWQSVEAGALSREEAREMLKRLAWQRGSSSTLRELAIDQLLLDTDNLDDTRSMFAYMLPTESRMGHLGVLEQIADAAVEQGWTNLKAPLVRSLVFEVPTIPDDERPEYRALAGLAPTGNASESVFAVFAGPPSEFALSDRKADTLEHRLDAWALLTRLEPDETALRTLIQRVALTPGLDREARRLIEDAREAVEIFRTVPTTPEQLEWVSRLRQGSADGLWSRGASLVQSLDDSRPNGLQLRHISGLIWAREHSPETYNSSRDELLAAVESKLDGVRKYNRESGLGAADRKREILHDWREQLSWADLVLIDTASRAIAQPSFAATIFSQADRDHNDRTTEYGGLIVDDGNGVLVPRIYSPRPTQRFGDQRFVAPEDMITQGDGATFHYHMQVQDHNNGDYAGPSRGDVEYAARYGRSCLVFTFVNDRTLNADYYQPNGARIDLGTISRPGS